MRRAIVSAMPALMLVAGGCGSGGVTPVTVAGHAFRIPAGHLDSGGGGDDGLSAVLNPQAPLPDRIRLTVEPASRLCAYRTPPVIDMLPRACAVATGKAGPVPVGQLVRKRRFPDDPTQYDYHGADGGVVAACSGEREGEGACTAIFAWRDLVWSASFSERHIHRLDEIVAQTGDLLDSWSGDDATA